MVVVCTSGCHAAHFFHERENIVDTELAPAFDFPMCRMTVWLISGASHSQELCSDQISPVMFVVKNSGRISTSFVHLFETRVT